MKFLAPFLCKQISQNSVRCLGANATLNAELAPRYIQTLVAFYKPARHLRFTEGNGLTVRLIARARSKAGEFAFSNAALTVTSNTTLKSFKAAYLLRTTTIDGRRDIIYLLLFLIKILIFIRLTPVEHLKYLIYHDNCFIYNPVMFTQPFYRIFIYYIYLFYY